MERKEPTSGLKWKTVIITTILTAIATLLVTVAAPIVIDIIKTPELRLEYYVQGTIPFKTPTEEMATYQIVLENTGTKVLEDVFCQISFADAEINQSTFFSEMPLDYNLTILGASLAANIADLNPQEVGTIYVLATSSGQLPTQPVVQLRAKGVSGVQGSPAEEKDISEVLTMALAATATAMTVILMSFRKLTKRSGVEIGFGPRRTQPDKLGYLCGIHGLTSDMERYYSASTEIYYRREADRFGTMAIKEPSERVQRMQVLKDLLEYVENITDESKAIVHYNIAKIAKISGDVKEEKIHLKEAKKTSPNLIKSRLRIDPIFKQKP